VQKRTKDDNVKQEIKEIQKMKEIKTRLENSIDKLHDIQKNYKEYEDENVLKLAYSIKHTSTAIMKIESKQIFKVWDAMDIIDGIGMEAINRFDYDTLKRYSKAMNKQLKFVEAIEASREK